MDPIIDQTATRIFSDHSRDPDALWSALEENGLTRVWVKEEEGGLAMSPDIGFHLMRLAGAHALPVPFAETLVSTAILNDANIVPPKGPIGFLIGGFQRGVPFGGAVDNIVRIHAGAVTLHRGPIQGDPLVTVSEDPVYDGNLLNDQVIATGTASVDRALAIAALARTAQICGAIETVLDLTIEFADQRSQFGRVLTKFQAIQHMLSDIAGETAAANASLDTVLGQCQSFEEIERQIDAVAIAKYSASLASGVVAEHAHQIHGAIGYTQEYDLARFTRRLWQWREDFGGETFWATKLGERALASGQAIWPQLTA